MSPTPLGPHATALETADAAGNPLVRLAGRLDALPEMANPAALPPPDPDNRVILRLGTPGSEPWFFAWVPRPAPDQPFHLTVKMIDPLGRVGRVEVEVPPLPPGPQLGSVAITPLTPPVFPPPRRLSVSWAIPMAIPPGMLGQYALTVSVLGTESKASLAAVPEVAPLSELSAAEIQALMGRIVRTAGQQIYAVILPFTRQRFVVRVELEDSVGRLVSAEDIWEPPSG